MIPGYLLSARPHRQFHTLPGLLESISYSYACVPMQGDSLYHFYDGLWYDPAGTRTHDLPTETRYAYTHVCVCVCVYRDRDLNRVHFPTFIVQSMIDIDD